MLWTLGLPSYQFSGGVYKIIFKALVSRLKSILGKIISNSHNAFIRGGQIMDSVLVGNECLVDLGNLVCCCKLDLERLMSMLIGGFCYTC